MLVALALIAVSAAAATMAPGDVAVDRAPKHCTAFSIDAAGRGHRFDVCRRQAMADLPRGPWSTLRAFADGGYLAASGTTLNVFDADDHLVRTLTPQIDGVKALAFDADAQSVWVATAHGVAKVSLPNGNLLLSVAGVGPRLEVYGEQRPASALAAVQDIPSLSTPFLVALAAALIAFAWSRLK